MVVVAAVVANKDNKPMNNHMKTIVIEWKHLEKEGRTCRRCSRTAKHLHEVLKEMKGEFKNKHIRVELIETKLPPEQIKESNEILIDGVLLEELTFRTSSSENYCWSCSKLTGKKTNCRTICLGNNTFETIPVFLIQQAILVKTWINFHH